MKLIFIIFSISSIFAVADDLKEVKSAHDISEYLIFDDQVEVKKLGVLQENFIIYNYSSYWGESKRASNRLIILDSNNSMIGMYAISMWAIRIENNCIIFPFDADFGNKICINSNAFPKVAWLDGENTELFR